MIFLHGLPVTHMKKAPGKIVEIVETSRTTFRGDITDDVGKIGTSEFRGGAHGREKEWGSRLRDLTALYLQHQTLRSLSQSS